MFNLSKQRERERWEIMALAHAHPLQFGKKLINLKGEASLFFFLLNYLISAHYFKINIIFIWLYSYLVCSMYEEAASLGSSVLKRLRDSNNNYNEESYDMMESAGMVFVQSLKELGRYITCFFIYRKCWLLFFEVLWLLIYSCCQI